MKENSYKYIINNLLIVVIVINREVKELPVSAD